MGRKKSASESIFTIRGEDAKAFWLYETGDTLSLYLKDSSVAVHCTTTGRLFQGLGPSFAKDPSR